jgi:hypothetical protein
MKSMLKSILIALVCLPPLIAPAQDKPGAEQRAAAKERAKEEKDEAKGQKERSKSEKDRDSERAYDRARKLMDKGQWDDALKALDELANRGGDRADAALYWKAYAQNKLGRGAEALETLAGLVKANPESRWLDDGKALEAEIRQSSGQKVDPDKQADEDLKLMAINSLMHSDPDKALPMLKKLLQTSQPLKVKEQALFVLSQGRSKEAREILGDFARGKSNPDLQMKSLEYLGLMGGPASRETLSEIYSSSTDKKIKRFILHAFMMGGDRERLVAAAKSEQDADLRMEAINQLGMLGGKDVLNELYAKETEVKVKRRILEALFMAGASDRLLELAQNEKDPQLRRSAIEKLGMAGEKTGDALVKMYATETDKDLRKKIIEALFMQNNAKAIVSIARTEKDPDLRKKAVEQLSMMNSKEGAAYFEEILSK